MAVYEYPVALLQFLFEILTNGKYHDSSCIYYHEKTSIIPKSLLFSDRSRFLNKYNDDDNAIQIHIFQG